MSHIRLWDPFTFFEFYLLVIRLQVTERIAQTDLNKKYTWTWLHSVAVSTSALHAEGPGFAPQLRHGPWSIAISP